MKSPLLAALVALQLATLGLVVGLLLRRNAPATDPRLDALTSALQGAIHQERVIIGHLEALRVQAARGAAPSSGATPAGPEGASGAPAAEPSTAPEAAAAASSSPFPAAASALAELERLHQRLREERESGSQNTAPLEREMAKRKSALIDHGHGALYVVRQAVDRQPYEPGFDARFAEFLLAEVVPPLSAGDANEAFDIARGALVRATNGPGVKVAAARTMRAIDSQRWVKDVCDVIALGSPQETEVRAQLLGMFETAPRPEAVELCKRILGDSRVATELRTRAVFVLAKQDSSAVVPLLRKVLFEEPAAILRIHALDCLLTRLGEEQKQRELCREVLESDPARMPDTVLTKARNHLESLDRKPDDVKPDKAGG